MVKRGQTLLREYEGVSSPKRRRTEVHAFFVSQSVTFLSSTFCRRAGKRGTGSITHTIKVEKTCLAFKFQLRFWNAFARRLSHLS
jgi:hypothetical protein